VVNIPDIRTVSIPRGKCLAPPKPLELPTLTFAQMAKRENRAVLASWDRSGSKYAGAKESVAANRLTWLADLPHGPFDRATVRTTWPVKDNTADGRVDTLTRAGLLRRLPGKPAMWERAE
jgi:hypothetical protein